MKYAVTEDFRSSEKAVYFARGIGFVWSLLIFVAAISTASAENGRDFSATYDFSSAIALDPNHVSVKFSIHLQNHSGADLTNATILLEQRSFPGKDSTPLTSGRRVLYRGSADASGTVTVRTQEYGLWQQGRHPTLVIRAPDRSGRLIDRPIELLRRTGMGVAR